ncbi:copper resistance protein B [Rhizorhapis sp. SPR117]|uniref:copper resistance protein B n=1 Tax=Rhizorhapis sp. SPR117 TaxID=2912611 RepID=UPI001F1A2DF2|nr:copper resistance protein B [Rhizorhapis sp. SPR117]
MLEPRLGLGWSAQAIPGEDLGRGLTDIEASLRLRRSLGKDFNIYAGVVHERLVGFTRTIAVSAGDPSRVTRAIVGLGFSF